MKSFKCFLKEYYKPMIDDSFWLNESMLNEGGISFVEIDHVPDESELIDEKDNEENEGFVRMTDPTKTRKNEKGRFVKVKPEDVEKYHDMGFIDGWRKEAEYYKSFAIQTANSKLGLKGKDEQGNSLRVANFSLPPITTCRSDAPCKAKCYAIKAYRQYPDCTIAWDKNLELMKSHPEWLERDMLNFFLGPEENGTRNEKKAKGKGITKFRWMVSGDLLNVDMLNQINNIAMKCDKVLFWLYTKRYEFLKGFTPNKNLKVIVSAWNEFMHDKVEELHKDFPVAYLDDTRLFEKANEKNKATYNKLTNKLNKINKPEYKDTLQNKLNELQADINKIDETIKLHKSVIPSDEEAFICPCADDKVDDVKDGDYFCSSCRTHVKHNMENGKSSFKSVQHPCYELQKGESLIFRIH